MILIYDVETTDKADFAAPADQMAARVCELAAILLDPVTLEPVGEPFCELILPDGWDTIDPGAHAVHGITVEQCRKHGIPIAEAVMRFDAMQDQATLIVGYSLRYDNKCMRGERRRLGRPDRFGAVPELDVMYEANRFVDVKGPTGRKKMPTLQEAHGKLVGEKFDEAHTALADVEATARVLRALHRTWKVPLVGKLPKTAEERAAEPKKPRKAKEPSAPIDIDNPQVF